VAPTWSRDEDYLWDCPVVEANHKKKKFIKLTKRINT
jgi:hypothetical protein